jgi:hypothetical protein
MEIFRSKLMYYLANFEYREPNSKYWNEIKKSTRKKRLQGSELLEGNTDRLYRKDPRFIIREDLERKINNSSTPLMEKDNASQISDLLRKEMVKDPKNYNRRKKFKNVESRDFRYKIEDFLEDLDKKKKRRGQVVSRLNKVGVSTPSQTSPEVKPVITSSRPDAKLILPSSEIEAPQDLILPKKKKKKVVTTSEAVSKTPTSPSKKGLEGFADSVSKEGFLGKDAPKVVNKVKPNRLGLKVLGGTALAGGALYGLNKLRKSRSDKGKTRGRYKR